MGSDVAPVQSTISTLEYKERILGVGRNDKQNETGDRLMELTSLNKAISLSLSLTHTVSNCKYHKTVKCCKRSRKV